MTVYLTLFSVYSLLCCNINSIFVLQYFFVLNVIIWSWLINWYIKLQFVNGKTNLRTRGYAYFCIFLNNISTSQSTCPRHDELALYSPPWCYLVNLSSWLPRSGSWFKSKLKSLIKKPELALFFFKVCQIFIYVYTLNKSMLNIFILNVIIRHYTIASIHFCYKPLLTVFRRISTTLLAFFLLFKVVLFKFEGFFF